jgi:hypothetical protein
MFTGTGKWWLVNGLKSKIPLAVITSVVVGTAITAISGLFKTPLTRIGVDVVQKGMPFPWIIRVIPMGDFIIWNMFLADVVVWVLVALVISLITIYVADRKG